MSILLSDNNKKYIMDWDKSLDVLKVMEFEIGAWNQSAGQYDYTLANTYYLQGAPTVGPSYGNMFDYVGGLTTTIATAGTPVLVNAVTTSVYANGFTHTNSRLTKEGDAIGPIKLEGIIAFNGTNNDELHVWFYKNGVQIPCSKGTMVIRGAGGNTIAFHCMTNMVDGDYIEVFVANVSGARNVTLENMNIILTEII